MKILISDFDKTFYTENYDNNIKLINEFVNAGNKFVIATGRPLYFLEPSIEGKNINYYNLICSDGTVIFDKNNKILFQEVIKKETIQTLIEKIIVGISAIIAFIACILFSDLLLKDDEDEEA